ncbi:PepSY-associated TM helix domain-containing protein [Schlesneria paludicola]|uniref:PepSY-associated TM helix domain-containing protein n=1 Tax=Schlesneria paludicola TaxID=360056 RepID=UPI00029A3EDA|nr:PepSY-associated TM helix domain-containing protein [Schlesneria paludicola]
MRLQLRKVWLIVHRWLGLTAGLLFALSGLTGSLIVFDHAIDEWLNSGIMLTRNQGSPLPLSKILAAAEKGAAAPGRAVNIYYPRVSNGTFTLYFREPDNSKKADTTEVFVDPVTAEILGQRPRESGLVAVIYRLHSKLLAGETGQGLLGGLAMLALVSLTSGLLLWWPLVRKSLWTGFGIRKRMRVFDTHKSLGASFSPILLLIVTTGVYLTLPDLIKPVVTAISPVTKLPGKVKSTVPDPRTPPIGPDAAAQVALETMPDCRLMSVDLPLKSDDSYRVSVRQVGEVGQLRGVGRVWVDQYQGTCLATRDWNKFTASDTFFRIQLALHSGDAFGIGGRWLFCLAGLVPATLYVTGFMMWRRRTKPPAARRTIADAQLASSAHDSSELVAANEATSTR